MAYKILTASETICDSTSQANGCINPKLSMTVNKVAQFEFTLTPDHPYYDKVQERKTELGVSLDGTDPIFWGLVYATKTDFLGRRTFLCEDMFGNLNDALMSPHRHTGMNVADIIQLAVNNFNAQCSDRQIAVGTVQSTHTAHDLAWSSNYESIMDMLQKNVIDKCGGYLRMRYDYANNIRYLDYSEAYGSTAQIISIGANLIDFVRDSDKSSMVSILIPLGARLPDSEQNVEGVEKRLTIYTDNRPTDRIESASLITAIGRKVGTRIWDNVEDPDDLNTYGTAWLSNQIEKVTIEAKAFDLNLADEDIDAIRLYDEVRVLSAPHNLDTRFPVMELEMNLNDPGSNTLVLGKTELPSLTQNTVQTAEAVKDVPTYVDVQTEAAKRAAEAIQQATNGYIQFVYNGNGVLEQILIKDITDPDNKWWRWSVGGLGYTSNGGVTYKVAMTMLGELVSDSGYIGGWEITANGLTKTVIDENDPTKVYRVTVYPPDASDPGVSKVFGFEISEDSGTTFTNSFYITGGGSIYMYTDNLNASFNLIGSGQGSYSAQITPSMLTMGNSTGYGRLYPGNVDGGLGSGTWTFGINATSGLRFSKNGVQTALYSAEGWYDVDVQDDYANSGTTTWHCIKNHKTVVACCKRQFTNVQVSYQWGGIYCGVNGDCNFKPIRLPQTFLTRPKIIVQGEPVWGGNDGWLVTNAAFTENNHLAYVPAYDLARGTSGTVPTYYVNYIIIGEVQSA